MQAPENDRLRREILDEVGPLLFEQLAADAWGRALIEVVRTAGGEPVVAGIDVDEIIGDEARVDAVFGGEVARAMLPMLAKATEALCGLSGVALDDVRGGTFVRAEQRFAWLPGLVRAPSLRLDRERDGLVARLRERNEELRARFPSDRVEFDVAAGEMRWLASGRVVGRAWATFLGTFAHAPRTWAWAWSNPSVAESTRRASAAIVDALEERDLWEIATPAFPTDEGTAWALAAFLCDRAGGDGVQRITRDDGAIFVLLRGARAADGD